MTSIINRLKLFLLGLRVFQDRTSEESTKPYLRDGIKSKKYGLILTDKAPIFRDYRIIHKVTFWFDSQGVFHHSKGVGRVGQDIDTILIIWLDSALAIYNGRYKVKGRTLEYDIFTSARLGHLKWEGESSTTDVKHFTDVLTRRPEVKSKFLPIGRGEST